MFSGRKLYILSIRIEYARSSWFYEGFSYYSPVHGKAFVRPSSGSVLINIESCEDVIVKLSCDECEGTMVGDVSGAGNNGTLIGGPIFDANTGDSSDFSIRFDGLDDYIDLGVLDVNGSGLTLAVWFKADNYFGSSHDPRFISKASGVAENDHVFMLGALSLDELTALLWPGSGLVE